MSWANDDGDYHGRGDGRDYPPTAAETTYGRPDRRDYVEPVKTEPSKTTSNESKLQSLIDSQREEIERLTQELAYERENAITFKLRVENYDDLRLAMITTANENSRLLALLKEIKEGE